MLTPGTYLQNRYEILERIDQAACLWCIRHVAIPWTAWWPSRY